MPKYIPKLQLHDISTSTVKELTTADLLYQLSMLEIENYSITPRVLRTKTFLVRNADTTPIVSKEEYEYGGNKVIKFSINVAYLQTDLTNSTLLGERVSFISSGSNISGTTTGYSSSASQTAILHSIEKKILIDAIQSSESIVLVDILERTNGQSINLDSSNKPAIHTVLLYKVLPGRTLVVDPSNFLFSSHLANTDFNKELADAGLPVIETIHKKIQIYKPNNEIGTGYAVDKYRDCGDLAVKLAFGFNKQMLTTFDKKSIEEHPVVIRLSNIGTIDKSIFEEKSVVRIKQTSSLLAQEEFAMLQSSIDQKLKMTMQTHDFLNVKYKYDYKVIIDSLIAPDAILNNLLALDQNYNQDLCDSLNATHQQLEITHNEYLLELTGQSTS